MTSLRFVFLISPHQSPHGLILARGDHGSCGDSCFYLLVAQIVQTQVRLLMKNAPKYFLMEEENYCEVFINFLMALYISGNFLIMTWMRFSSLIGLAGEPHTTEPGSKLL